MRRHLLLLGLVLLVVWPLLNLDGSFTTDEGSYALQARTLGEGTWDMGYAFAAADPDAVHAPFHGASLTAAGEVVPYAKHPLVPELMRVGARVFGESTGFRLLGVGSVAVLAGTAWAIAGDLGSRRARPWAFWFAATSPVLANAWTLWPHAPSAAVSGLLVLGVLRAERSRGWVALAVASAAACVLLRSEGLLFVGAVAAGVVLLTNGWHRRVLGLLIGLSGGAALLIERAWRDSILGGGVDLGLQARGSGSGLAERMVGLRIALLDGAAGDRTGQLVALVVIALVLAAALRLRQAPDAARGSGALLIVAAVLLAMRHVVASDDPALGLFAAMPLALLVVAWRPGPTTSRWLVGAVGLFVGAVAATTYADGGGFQWGGRFFSPLLAPLSAIAGAVVAGWLDRPAGPAGRRDRMIAVGVMALMVIQGVASIVGPNSIRTVTQDRIDMVARQGEAVIVAPDRMIPRLDWRSWPDRCWISLMADDDLPDAASTLRVLIAGGVDRAAYAGIAPQRLVAAGAVVVPDPRNPAVGTFSLQDPASVQTIAAPYSCAAPPNSGSGAVAAG